jgi:mitochondrial fission protein ELM1
VICAGKRAVPVALWIRKQSEGRTKIIHLGRPRVPLHRIDLIITTPQYGLPRSANVIERPMPFASPQILRTEEMAIWQRRFAELPRPWTGVLVGGSAFPLFLDDSAISRLASRISEMREQGSVLVSTSPRTGAGQAEKLAGLIKPPAYVHVFGNGDNPHQAILALADRFVVTSDSVSMQAEAVETGRPVEVFELPRWRFAPSWQGRSGLGAWLAVNGVISPPRDPGKVLRHSPVFDDAAIFARIHKLMRES